MLTALAPAVDGHVSAVAARHCPRSSGADGTRAADDFELPDRLCRRPVDLRPAVGSARPPPGSVRGARPLHHRHAHLRGDAIHRPADRGAVPAGDRRGGLDRAGARHGARSLFRRARGARAVADGLDQRLCADRGADDRRRAADRVRLARELHRHGRCRRDRHVRGAPLAAGDAARSGAANRSRCRL